MIDRETFADYGIDIRGQTHGNIKTLCPKCSHLRKKKDDPCLSVNIDNGVWQCHNGDCGFSGVLKTKYDNNYKGNYGKYMQEKEITKVEVIAPEEVKSAEIDTKQLVSLTPEAIQWLKAERGISEDIANMAGLKSVVKGSSQVLAFPFWKDNKIVNIKYRSISEKKFSQSKGGEQCFYQYNSLKDTDTIIITEGELDCLAVMESGFNNVLSCPAGAAPISTKDLTTKLAFISDSVLDIIANNVKKVILAMDKDEVGKKWETSIANKIGEDICFTVDYPEGCKDANDVLKKHGKEVLNRCIKKCKPLPVKGIAVFSDFSKDIDTRSDKNLRDKGKSTGWRTLDEYFKLKVATLNIITGIPGSGKSEWLDHLMLNSIGMHKWKWAIYSPENYPIDNHFYKLAEKVVGKPEDKMTVADRETVKGVLDEHIKILTIDDEGVDIDTLLKRLKVCVKRYGVNAFIADPYNEITHERSKGMSETEYISTFLSKVRNFGRLYNVAMFIVAHPTKLQKKDNGEYPVPTPYDINGSANFRNKADNCISVWRSYKKNDGIVQIHIQKIRDKNLGRLGSIELKWDFNTGRFSDVSRYGKDDEPN